MMDGIFVRAAVARMDERNSFILVLWHDKGRTIMVLEDNGTLTPLDSASAGALADLLEDLL